MSNQKLNGDYDGKTKLREWWPDVKSNFTKLFTWFNEHISGTADRHKADDIDYSINETVKGIINNTVQGLTKETEDRKSSDAKLQNNLTQETADRLSADTKLQNNLTQEIADRKSSDTKFQTSIDDIQKYAGNTVYSIDISKVGSGNNILYTNIDGVTTYDQLNGKMIALNTGAYQCTFSTPSTVYVNINGLGSRALKRPLPCDHADYDTKQYYTDKYCYGEIGRHQTLLCAYDGSSFVLCNVAVPPKSTSNIKEYSTDGDSYTTPKAVADTMRAHSFKEAKYDNFGHVKLAGVGGSEWLGDSVALPVLLQDVESDMSFNATQYLHFGEHLVSFTSETPGAPKGLAGGVEYNGILKTLSTHQFLHMGYTPLAKQILTIPSLRKTYERYVYNRDPVTFSEWDDKEIYHYFPMDGDFDEFIKPGFYGGYITKNAPNNANNDSWTAIVIQSEEEDFLHQIAIAENTNEFYIRNRSAGIFREWKRIGNENSFIAKLDKRITVPSTYLDINSDGDWIQIINVPGVKLTSSNFGKFELPIADSLELASTYDNDGGSVSCYAEYRVPDGYIFGISDKDLITVSGYVTPSNGTKQSYAVIKDNNQIDKICIYLGEVSVGFQYNNADERDYYGTCTVNDSLRMNIVEREIDSGKDMLSSAKSYTDSKTGNPKLLKTNDKSSLVGAINELALCIETLQQKGNIVDVRLDGLDAELVNEVQIINLTNTLKVPFNNSAITVSLQQTRETLNYDVIAEVVSVTGGLIGDITVTEKQLNGFKIAFDGSATEATLKLKIRGGIIA